MEISHEGASLSMLGIVPVLLIVIYVVLFGIGVYCLILFIKIARRGIKALDIYLDEKNGSRRL